MDNILAYVAALLVFGILDSLWLGAMSSRLYRPALGDILLERLRLIPALIFYFAYPIGILFFAAIPATDAFTALLRGSLFGLFAYGTYDLTNQATLRRWTLRLTLVDLAYGTVAAALTSVSAFLMLRWAAG